MDRIVTQTLKSPFVPFGLLSKPDPMIKGPVRIGSGPFA